MPVTLGIVRYTCVPALQQRTRCVPTMSKRNLDIDMRHGCVHAADLSHAGVRRAATCATLPHGGVPKRVTPDDLSHCLCGSPEKGDWREGE